MIIKKDILSSLKRLETHYNAAQTSIDARDPVYYSKTSTLELCGWIEESMDKIIERTLKDKLTSTGFKDTARDYIRNNYGFTYKKHFRPLLIKTSGLRIAEIFEEDLQTSGNLQILISKLDTMNDYRNSAAHLWIGSGANYPSPSLLIGELNILYPILRALYSKAVSIAP